MKKSIPWAKPVFSGREKEYLLDALESSWISGGQYIDRFEEEFTRHSGSRHGITTSNGTTALQLALLGLDVGPGDEVIVPGFTFVAPVNMVIAAGATPVYADIDGRTWCIDPASVEGLVTPRTKAIIAVHLYGNVCDMDAINAIAARRRLAVVEDTAEAAFSKYKGRYAGTLGDVGCFSFQATKTITMGEGGIVLTDSDELDGKMRVIRDHGMRKGKRYWHDAVGFNFRLTNLQAAVGCGQFENIGDIIANRRRVFGLYHEELGDTQGVQMQHFPPEVEPVVWAIAVKVDKDAFKGDRDFLMGRMTDAGIETRPGFYPLGVMPLYDTPVLPVSAEVGLNVISLPSYPSLTEEDIRFICDRFRKLRR
jgi:perosamine synthetase